MTNLRLLSVDKLAIRCRAGGDEDCWELFRRAVVENNQQAWDALYVQYRRLVGKWRLDVHTSIGLHIPGGC